MCLRVDGEVKFKIKKSKFKIYTPKWVIFESTRNRIKSRGFYFLLFTFDF